MSLSRRVGVLSIVSLFSSVQLFAVAYRTTAWIAPWNPSSLTSIQVNAAQLSESNPVWYELDSRGNIVAVSGANDPTWRSAMVGTTLLPTLQNRVSGSVDASETRSLISSKRRGGHVQAIVNLTIANGYDGIEIDYENMSLSDRPNYTAFIQLLASQLHANGKKLSVVVSPKTSDAQNWAGPGAEDYAAIAVAVDEMKIMCYDYHWDTSNPGPIAPLDWIDSVTTYAESVAASAKIVIGLPWYGYDWVGSSGTSISYSSAMNTALANGVPVTHDVNGEATYAYGSHIVYFQDAASYNAKADMLTQKHPNLAGFAHWVAGVEDAAIWSRVALLKNGVMQPTTTSISSSRSASPLAQAVTFTATIASSGSPATGRVTFVDGSSPLGSSAATNGQATFTTSTLAVGTHSIAANYSGDGGHLSSSSAPLVQTITPGNSAVALTASPSPSTFGQSVTLTATVSGAGARPTGSVTFTDGGSPAGTATLSGAVATLTLTGLAAGAHSFGAQYSGDGNFNPSGSAAVAHTVTPAATTASVAASPNPSILNQTVTLTATVASPAGVPAGTVSFADGATPLGSAVLDASGRATFATSTLTVGAHNLTAQYGGSANFAASTSAAVAQQVSAYLSTTSLTSSLNPATYGSAFTLTAFVMSDGGAPTGTVTFKDGGTVLGSSTITAGQATYSPANMTAGAHSLTAVYAGDGTFASSTSAVVTETVNKADTTTTVASSVNPSSYGQPFVLTATVASAAGAPAGSVTFFDGGSTLGTATLTNGSVSMTIGSLAVGPHSISAQYGGAANYNGSTSAAVGETVNAAATSTTLASSANPASAGATVTFTAKVTSPYSTPVGTVTFKDNSSVLATQTLDTTGTATFATSSLSAGTHPVTAEYAGSSSYAASVSAPVSQVITVAAGYKIAVWIAPWSSASLTSVQQHAGSMTESNPVWYTLNSSGAPVADSTANNPTWRAAMTGTLIMPTIQNSVSGSFSKSVVETLIATAASRDAHAQTLTNLVVNNAYDGIDIDYEGLALSDRSNFTAFATTLASKLHAAGKLLSMTVSAKTSDSQTWDGPGADDYAALGGVADFVKLMIYDYSWSTSAPGPITPLNWLDNVLTYAESVIPPSKIIAGLPWYGYDWAGSNGTGVGYQQAMNTAASKGATITHDVNGEATYTYPTNHTVYFQDAYSYDQKVNLVKSKHARIGGFAHWVAGDEDPAIWTRVSALKSGT